MGYAGSGGSDRAPGKGRARRAAGDGHDRGPPEPPAGIGLPGHSRSLGPGVSRGRARGCAGAALCRVKRQKAERSEDAAGAWAVPGPPREAGARKRSRSGAGRCRGRSVTVTSLTRHQRIPNPAGTTSQPAVAAPALLLPPLRASRDRIRHHLRGAPCTRRGSGSRIRIAGRGGGSPGAAMAPTPREGALGPAVWCHTGTHGCPRCTSQRPGEGRVGQGCVVATQGSACQQDSCTLGAAQLLGPLGCWEPVGQPPGGYGQDAVLTPGLGFWRTLELSRCTALILVLALSSWAGSPSLKARLQAWC